MIYSVYHSVNDFTVLSNAGCCAPYNPPMGCQCSPTSDHKNKESSTQSQHERASGRLGSTTPAWRSYTHTCHEYMENSLYFWTGVGEQQPPMWGLQGAQTPALDNIVTDSVYIVYILPHNFPDTFHTLPCYQGQECGGWGGFRTMKPSLNFKE